MDATLAIATCRAWPGLLEDDAPLVAALAQHGIATEAATWDLPNDWARFDAVLLRSVWDYFERPRAFDAWLAGLLAVGVPCWNAPALVRWNADKRYLRELAARGVPVPPTLFLEPGTSVGEAAAAVAAHGWDDLVVKPAVSAGAWRTRRVRARDRSDLDAALDDALATGAALVQPFLPEVLEQGELSFVFFEGAFSHAVEKRAKPGDYRVQWTHGGRHRGIEAAPDLVAQAQRILAQAPEPGLYARVDGIVRAGRLQLMELEQIEPFLFFAEGPGAAERLAALVAHRLARA